MGPEHSYLQDVGRAEYYAVTGAGYEGRGGGGRGGSGRNSTSFRMHKFIHTFNMDYAALSANSTKLAAFSAAIAAAIAAAANIPSSYVSIISITSGSVVCTSQISFPAASYTADQVTQKLVAWVGLESEPLVVFGGLESAAPYSHET